jgi:LppP/LprE lipoprotein
MDPEARRVKAERDRRRLPRRNGPARWARRIAGLLGTAALLGVGVVSAQMIRPDDGGEAVIAATPSPTATPKPKASKKTDTKPKRKALTKKQKAAREAAIAEVRSQGFTTLKDSDYDPRATLRVLIARPVGDAAGGYRAFFFVKDRYIGNDSRANSSILRVSSKGTGKRQVTLSYGVYAPGDTAGEPSQRKRVRFKLEGEQLVPQDEIPFENLRLQRRQS